MAFAVLKLTGSAANVGIVLSMRFIPLVLFILVGGVWGDRLPRRSLMAGAQLFSAACQGLAALLVCSGTGRVWQLALLYFLLGAALAVYRPASSGLVPETAPREHLQRANAMLGMADSTGLILGPALAGVLVATADPGWAIAVDAGTFLVSGALLLAMRSLPKRVQWTQPDFRRELVDGFHAVRTQTWLWTNIVYFALFQFAVLGYLYVLGPVVAANELGGARTWGLLLTASGFGSVLGGMVALRASPSRPLLVADAVLLGVTLIFGLLAVGAPVAVLVIGMLVFGVTLSCGSTLWETVLQQHVPGALLSRVSAYDWMGSTALRPLGLAAAGPTAILLGLRPTLLLVMTVTALSTLALLALPSIRCLGQAPDPRPAP